MFFFCQQEQRGLTPAGPHDIVGLEQEQGGQDFSRRAGPPTLRGFQGGLILLKLYDCLDAKMVKT